MAFAMLDAPRAARALLTASAVRERSAKMLDLGMAGSSPPSPWTWTACPPQPISWSR